MGVCCDFNERKKEILVKKLVEDFYLYIWDLSTYLEVEFLISASELSFIFGYIYDTLEIKNYQEFHEVVDIYVCYMLIECDRKISMHYLMKSFKRHLDQLIQFLCQSQIAVVHKREGKVLHYG